LSITAREGRVAYIGHTVFVSSGSSSTTAQVTLTASVFDDGTSVGSVTTGTVTFTDLLSGKVLASNVPVALVNGDTHSGTANTIVTLSTGQYGAQQYLIEVTLNGQYKNLQQTGAASTSDAYKAAHPVVTVMIPETINSTQGAGTLPKLASAAGTYGDATSASYTMGLAYTNTGTNPQGQIQLVLLRPDGTYFVKSNSLTSLAFSKPGTDGFNKDVTVYTKASIYKVTASGITSVDGNVTLRIDAHEGCVGSPCSGSSGDAIGFTVLSSKNSALYYSNNWIYDTAKKGYATVMQAIAQTVAVVIH
jgi:hypothetical protein